MTSPSTAREPAAPPHRLEPTGRLSPVATGGELWLLEAGHGGPAGTVVLLHSAVGNAQTFRHQYVPLARAGLRVLAYDRRGMGNTPHLPPGATKAPVQDLAALLDAAGATGPVHLLGAAAGGRLALDFAAAWPERLASLTLVSSIAGLGSQLYPGGTERLLPPEFLALPPYLRELGPAYRGEDPRGTDEWRGIVETAAPAGVPRTPAKARTVIPSSTDGLRHLRGLAAGGGPSGTGVPVTLITGDADPYATAAAYRRLAGLLPDARLHIIPEAGHSPYWERPREFNDALLASIHAAAAAQPATTPRKVPSA